MQIDLQIFVAFFVTIYCTMIVLMFGGVSVKDGFLVLITRQKALNKANFKNIRLVKD